MSASMSKATMISTFTMPTMWQKRVQKYILLLTARLQLLFAGGMPF